jgi:hypothetical protein
VSPREKTTVPAATVEAAPDFASYYGHPILKQPTWKVPDVPLYLFSGGLAGASAVLAELAARTGRPGLSGVARLGAAGGAVVGAGLLVHDLGRPTRFLHMLRMLKPTSPLSVGTWILSPFATLGVVAAASAVTGRAPTLGRAAGLGAAALGGPMTTYTAVLLSNTAIPAWHEAQREMPIVFAGSALAAAGGLGMLGAPIREIGPAVRLGVLGAAVELTATAVLERRLGFIGEHYRRGRAGAWMRAARASSAAGILGALLGRHRPVAVAAGAALLVGSAATRFGVFEAGRASAADPRDVIVPQRERDERRQAASAATATAEPSRSTDR